MKKVLILGGSSDIGLEVVKIFLDNDWKVFAHYNKNKKNLLKIKKKFQNLKLIKFNLSRYKDKDYLNKLKKSFKLNADSFINLVGYTDGKSFSNTTLHDLVNTLTINTVVPIILQKYLIDTMLKNKWGRIINCSGIGVKYGGGKFNYNYSLSQHTREFIPSVYKEWAQNNVLINNIRIGVTDTKLHKRVKKNMSKRINMIPIKRMATPNEIAIYIFKLSSENNTYITGQTITVSGGE